MQKFFASIRKRSILLIVFCALSMLVFIGRAAYSVIQWVINPEMIDLAPVGFDALSLLTCAVLLLPLLLDSIRQLQGKNLPILFLRPISLRALLILVVLWVVMVTTASILSELSELSWLLAAPAFIIAILIPVMALAWIGAGGLVTAPRRRLWAALGLGMSGATGLALALEYLVIGIAALVGWLVTLVNPEFKAILQDLQVQFTSAGNMQEAITLLAPYITNPWIFLLILTFAAVLTPLIEEAVKPLAVWILRRDLRSPAEGFALGALGGAGFAILEGLLASSTMSSYFYFGIPARAASSLMHITLSAMMGWGIVSSTLERRYARGWGIYLGCACLHGLWNGSAMLAVYGSLKFSLQPEKLDMVNIMLMMAGVGIIGLVFVCISILLPLLNRKLQKSQSDIIAPLASQPEKDLNGLDS